ncbi:unnamed protein product [Closterium sp. NIES-54]
MASLNVLTFDAEGRAVDFEVWLDDLQLFLQCDSKDGLSLFDLTSGASTAPTADADSTVRSQWFTRDAAARLAVRNHLPSTERAHFSQYKSARALYDAVVARYSSPTTAALSRLMLPYLFPDLAAFSTVADLVAHLRTSDARYRAALPTEFLPTNSPPILGPSAPRLLTPPCPSAPTAALATTATATAATAAPAYCTSMALLRVLTFDHEGRPIQFDTWLDDLQLYLLSDSKDSVSLFDLASSTATAPPTTPDSATRSQWLTPQALYDAVVTRYSSPATAALGRLLPPYLFPELSAFATKEGLVSHLRASDASYRATVHAKFLDRNPPPMFITLYFIVTRLPDSLRSVRDNFLSLDPTSLTVDLLEEHLLAAETSAVAVGATGGAGGIGAVGSGGAGATGAGAAGPGGARTRGAGAGGDARARGAIGAAGTGGAGAAGAGGTRGAAGTGGARAGGTRGTGAASGMGTVQRRPFFYPHPQSSLPPPDSALRQVHSLSSSIGLTPPLLCPPTDQSQPQLLPSSPLPAPTPHTERVALPSPQASSLPVILDTESNLARAASPTVTRLLVTVVTDPDFEYTAAFALVTELVDIAARSRLDYVV